MRWPFLPFALFVLSASAHAAPPSIEGVWGSDEKNHRIELFLRKAVLYGRVVWTRDPDLTDEHNPDPELRARKVAGIEHIGGFTRSRDGGWNGGTLYNPEDGASYQATLRLDGDDRLVIQGRPNVPIIGGLLGALFGRITYARERGSP